MFELTEHLNSTNLKIAEPADTETAITKMYTTAGSYFEHLWQSELTEAERETLLAIVNRKSLTDGSERTIKSLIRKEILCKEDDGDYTFCVPVLREWILKYV